MLIFTYKKTSKILHLHHINDLIQLQDVTVRNYHISEDNVLFLTLCPISGKQSCPCCHTQEFVICKGSRQKLRQVRHLRCFNHETILLVPMKCLFCKQCEVSFTYQYAFITGKTRYINDYKQELSKPLVGTVIQKNSWKYMPLKKHLLIGMNEVMKQILIDV